MTTSPEFIQAMQQLQPDAQSALPVIPNNGNPNGANNMPSYFNGGLPAQGNGQTPMPPTQIPVDRPVGQGGFPNGGHFYPWMQPGAGADYIHQMLQLPVDQGFGNPGNRQIFPRGDNQHQWPTQPSWGISGTGVPGTLPILPNLGASTGGGVGNNGGSLLPPTIPMSGTGAAGNLNNTANNLQTDPSQYRQIS